MTVFITLLLTTIYFVGLIWYIRETNLFRRPMTPTSPGEYALHIILGGSCIVVFSFLNLFGKKQDIDAS